MRPVGWYGVDTLAWNPFAGCCTPVSAGCAHCWARGFMRRHAANPTHSDAVRAAYAGTGPVVLNLRELDAPRRRRKPAVIATQFMGDLWQENVPAAALNRVWQTMFNVPRHRFLMLTKRPGRLADWTARKAAAGAWPENEIWPDHVWLGTSAEDQASLDARLPYLMHTPAAHRWLSLEPLLGRVTIPKTLVPIPAPRMPDWVVIGCESGAGRRPCDLEWVKAIVADCALASVPVYVKQLDLGGRVSRDPAEWPAWARVRQTPW